jgi:hypothetical protein
VNLTDTQLTEHAIKCFVHFLRDSRRNGLRQTGAITPDELSFAKRRLNEIMSTATYRDTDTQGRELWRSPPRAYNLRWLLAYESDRKFRKVIWVGAGRPPPAMWSPKDES